jgi:hypothetical protein
MLFGHVHFQLAEMCFLEISHGYFHMLYIYQKIHNTHSAYLRYHFG